MSCCNKECAYYDDAEYLSCRKYKCTSFCDNEILDDEED